jgi:hypothetical protein
MKAWHVVATYDSFLADIVHAETRGQAVTKSWMFKDEGLDFIELRARREPKLDNVELTPRAIYDAGYMVPCEGCGEFTLENWDDDKVLIVGEKVWHESCLVARCHARDAVQTQRA